MTVGLISDTHGLMRESALAALRGSDLIIHAGDLGTPAVLDTLRAVAPVVAVRGNIDTGNWAAGLPATAVAEAGPARIFVVPAIPLLALDPTAPGLHPVVDA